MAAFIAVPRALARLILHFPGKRGFMLLASGLYIGGGLGLLLIIVILVLILR